MTFLLRLPRRPVGVAATADEHERITSALLDAPLASGYVKSPPAASQKRRSAAPTDEKIRRLVRRLHLSSSDADLLLGILRQILWKSRSANDLRGCLGKDSKALEILLEERRRERKL